MNKKTFLELAFPTLVLSASSLPAPAEKLGAPILGYTFRAGHYEPNEPYREGQTRVTGLQHPFPRMRAVEENPVTPAKVHLGKLLYFDRILSGDNTISCAHCHHPDFGFSDGRKTSMGLHGRGVGPERSGGDVLARAAPVLWNAAYNPLQFWDGRAKDLEQQAGGPIQDGHEMNQNAAELVKELKRESSIWVKTKSPTLADFYWQGGYGAFSVSPAHVEILREYIANQEEHHRTVGFQDEFREFCRRHGVEFDERYVWD